MLYFRDVLIVDLISFSLRHRGVDDTLTAVDITATHDRIKSTSHLVS